MFTKKIDDLNGLKEIINILEDRVKNLDPEDDKYNAHVEQLTKLYKIKESNSPRQVDPDALISAAASILGIVLVLNFEKLNVLTSKAFGLIRFR